MTAEIVSPSTALEDAANAVGSPMQLLWRIKGPAGTKIAWLSCYSLASGMVIVPTANDGQWFPFTATLADNVDAAIADVFNRCQVPLPPSAAVIATADES